MSVIIENQFSLKLRASESNIRLKSYNLIFIPRYLFVFYCVLPLLLDIVYEIKFLIMKC